MSIVNYVEKIMVYTMVKPSYIDFIHIIMHDILQMQIFYDEWKNSVKN